MKVHFKRSVIIIALVVTSFILGVTLGYTIHVDNAVQEQIALQNKKDSSTSKKEPSTNKDIADTKDVDYETDVAVRLNLLRVTVKEFSEKFNEVEDNVQVLNDIEYYNSYMALIGDVKRQVSDIQRMKYRSSESALASSVNQAVDNFYQASSLEENNVQSRQTDISTMVVNKLNTGNDELEKVFRIIGGN